jgi:hypothetical protein
MRPVVGQLSDLTRVVMTIIPACVLSQAGLTASTTGCLLTRFSGLNRSQSAGKTRNWRVCTALMRGLRKRHSSHKSSSFCTSSSSAANQSSEVEQPMAAACDTLLRLHDIVILHHGRWPEVVVENLGSTLLVLQPVLYSVIVADCPALSCPVWHPMLLSCLAACHCAAI